MNYKVGDRIKILKVFGIGGLSTATRQRYQRSIGKEVIIKKISSVGTYNIEIIIDDENYSYCTEEIEKVLEYNRNGANT